MSLVTAGLRLAVLALPAVLRRRYHEEWSADLAGARQLGLSPAAILAGAFGTVLSIDRTDPLITGLPRSELRRRRRRWAAALLSAAVLLSADVYLRGDAGVMGAIKAGIVAAGVVAGSWMLVGMLRIPYERPVAPRPAPWAEPVPASTRWAIGLGFALATLAAVTVGLLHIAVWNPLAKVPGATLDEIYATLATAGEGAGTVWLITWALLAVGASLWYLVVDARRPTLTRRRLVTTGLVLLGGTITVGWFAGFAMGMSLADAFAIDGGDAAPTGPALATIGQLALTGGLILGLAPPAIPRRRTA